MGCRYPATAVIDLLDGSVWISFFGSWRRKNQLESLEWGYRLCEGDICEWWGEKVVLSNLARLFIFIIARCLCDVELWKMNCCLQETGFTYLYFILPNEFFNKVQRKFQWNVVDSDIWFCRSISLKLKHKFSIVVFIFALVCVSSLFW